MSGSQGHDWTAIAGRDASDPAPSPAPQTRPASTAARRSVSKISVSIQGHRTSISLEPAFWDAFRALCKTNGLRTTQVLATIDHDRTGNLSSAIRLWVLDRLLENVNTPTATTPDPPATPPMSNSFID